MFYVQEFFSFFQQWPKTLARQIISFGRWIMFPKPHENKSQGLITGFTLADTVNKSSCRLNVWYKLILIYCCRKTNCIKTSERHFTDHLYYKQQNFWQQNNCSWKVYICFQSRKQCWKRRQYWEKAFFFLTMFSKGLLVLHWFVESHNCEDVWLTLYHTTQTFNDPGEKSRLKTLWEKELITFSPFPHNDFYPISNTSHHLSYI